MGRAVSCFPLPLECIHMPARGAILLAPNALAALPVGRQGRGIRGLAGVGILPFGNRAERRLMKIFSYLTRTGWVPCNLSGTRSVARISERLN